MPLSTNTTRKYYPTAMLIIAIIIATITTLATADLKIIARLTTNA